MALAIGLACALAIVTVGLGARLVLREQINGAIVDRQFRVLAVEHARLVQQQGRLDLAGTLQIERRREPRPRLARDRRSSRSHFNRPSTYPLSFLVLNTRGKIIEGSDQFPVGQSLPVLLRLRQRAISLEGRTVAYAVPVGQPVLGSQERAMLSMFDRALLRGVLVASIIGVLVSVLLSQRLASALQELEDSHRSFSDQASKLRELSIRDELTGLYNRRHFNQQVKLHHERALRNGRPLCLVMADIDHFKRINDSFGHATGDAVLNCIGKLFLGNVRNGDLAARIGGEEFVIAFPETSTADAGAMCERLRLMISAHPWDTIAEGLTVTISMGLFGGSGSIDCDDMLRIADRHLYRAKASGRNRLVAC